MYNKKFPVYIKETKKLSTYETVYDTCKQDFELHFILKSSIKDYLFNCEKCRSSKIGLKSFKILRSCANEYETNIYKALLIKKFNPKLNKQLYVK